MKIMREPPKSGMKFKSATNNLFAIGLVAVLLCSCGNLQYPVSESHTFQYTRVTKNGEILFDIEPGDTMNLLRDGRFNYCIKKPGKNAGGTWKLLEPAGLSKNPSFEFTYLPDNQIRTFEICRYNRKTLILCEGPLRFEYKRIR